ncbi:MAG: hypothetical protein AB8G05_22645 [Oligoflexales bacterium]
MRHSFKNLTKWFVMGSFLIGSVISCGTEEEQTEYENSQDKGSDRYAPVKQTRQSQQQKLIEVPVLVEQGQGGSSFSLTNDGLGLVAKASATSYKLSVTSCLSGYTQTDVTASTVYVYEFDASCVAFLTEIVFDSVTYDLTHADAVAWSGTSAGDTATMVATTATAGLGNATDEEKLEVIIDATFSATVAGGDVLTFSFRQFVKDTNDNTLAVSVVDDGGHTVTVSGNKAPNFTIESVTLRSLDGTDGYGNWEFQMLCGTELTDTDTKCGDVLLTDIQYTLIIDTFGGGEPTRSNLDDAIGGTGLYTLFGAESVIVGDVNASVASTYNGGFSTKGTGGTSYISLSSATRTNIHTDQNMILVLEANDSYRYFRVDVTPVSN